MNSSDNSRFRYSLTIVSRAKIVSLEARTREVSRLPAASIDGRDKDRNTLFV